MKTDELWSLLLEAEQFDSAMNIYIFAGTLPWPHPVIGVLMSAAEGLPEVPMQDVAIVYVLCAGLCRGMSAQNMVLV